MDKEKIMELQPEFMQASQLKKYVEDNFYLTKEEIENIEKAIIVKSKYVMTLDTILWYEVYSHLSDGKDYKAIMQYIADYKHVDTTKKVF